MWLTTLKKQTLKSLLRLVNAHDVKHLSVEYLSDSPFKGTRHLIEPP